MTQLEMTTSTLASGSGSVLDVALEELGVGGAGLGGVAAGELEHLVGHVEPDRAPGGADAAGGDEDVGAGARAEVEHGFALVQVGDGGRNAAAERRRDRALSGALAGLGVVEHVAELAASTGRAAAGFLGLAGGSRGDIDRELGVAGVALAHLLADVGVGQLGHGEGSFDVAGGSTARSLCGAAAGAAGGAGATAGGLLGGLAAGLLRRGCAAARRRGVRLGARQLSHAVSSSSASGRT